MHTCIDTAHICAVSCVCPDITLNFDDVYL